MSSQDLSLQIAVERGDKEGVRNLLLGWDYHCPIKLARHADRAAELGYSRIAHYLRQRIQFQKTSIWSDQRGGIANCAGYGCGASGCIFIFMLPLIPVIGPAIFVISFVLGSVIGLYYAAKETKPR